MERRSKKEDNWARKSTHKMATKRIDEGQLSGKPISLNKRVRRETSKSGEAAKKTVY